MSLHKHRRKSELLCEEAPVQIYKVLSADNSPEHKDKEGVCQEEGFPTLQCSSDRDSGTALNVWLKI